MTQNFVPDPPHSLGAHWSLAIEEQFYFLLPALVVFLNSKQLLRLAFTVVIGSIVARALEPFSRSYVWSFGRFDGLFTGVLLSYAFRNPAARDWMIRHISSIKYFAWILFTGVVVIAFQRMRFGSVAYTWLAAFFGCIVVISLLQPEGMLARGMRMRWLMHLGQIAYGLYLFHQPINGFFHGWAHGGAPELTNTAQAALAGLSFCALLVVANISYRFFELPLMNLGRRMKYVTTATC